MSTNVLNKFEKCLTGVIYHADCVDGAGSAWVASLKLGTDDVIYYPSYHNQKFPENLIPEGVPVYIFDFSYDRQTIVNLQKRQNGQLKLIDHHKSALEQLDGLDCCQIDLSHSGAVLAWKHFYPDKSIPQLLNYIEDRDLWNWQLPDSRAINSYIETVVDVAASDPLTVFSEFQSLRQSLEANLQSVVESGQSICLYRDRQVKLACQKAQLVDFNGHRIIVANSPILKSEIGAYLLKTYPDVPFCGVWNLEKPGLYRWSLRSREGEFDVSKLATSLGGGGHPCAAGFYSQAQDFQMDSDNQLKEFII